MSDPPPVWGDDWAGLRAQWALDPAVAHLNHGAFGATPRPVLAAQTALRAEMERDPVGFLSDTFAERVAAARETVAEFLRADVEGLALLPNTTTGVQTVLASLPLGPGDEVLTTDHVYPAVRRQLDALAERTGCAVVFRPVDLPTAGPDELREAVLAGVTERTRLVVVDHVASVTAVRFPAAEIVRGCRAVGVPVLVDAAHAPGMLDVDVTALDADFWVGNLHKWVCAPKGSAALWLHPRQRGRVRPLVAARDWGLGYHREFDWTGTVDPTPWLATPAALDFLAGVGWERLRRYDAGLARWGAGVVAAAIGAAPAVAAPEVTGSMTAVAVPVPPAAADALHLALRREHGVQVPALVWRDRVLLRLSAQVYNRPEDYARLAAALPSAVAQFTA